MQVRWTELCGVERYQTGTKPAATGLMRAILSCRVPVPADLWRDHYHLLSKR
jgi:hypothetical protein